MSLAVRLSVLAAAILLIPACGEVRIDSDIAGTSDKFPENGLFYSKDSSDGLKSVLVPGTKVTEDRKVLAGDSITIIIDAVYIPNCWISKANILFLLDLQTDKDVDIRRLPFFYQEQAQGGKVLAFRDLTVTNCPSYDPGFNPYFRLRVIALDPPSKELKSLLGGLSNLSQEIGQFFPNPYLPAFGAAVKLGEAIFNTNQDKIILDYQFQLYSSQIDKTVGIGRLQYGEWVALGIPQSTQENPNAAKEFWSRTYSWDSRQRRVTYEQGSEVLQLDVPFVTFSIGRGYSVVPAVVQRRAAEIMSEIEKSRTDMEQPRFQQLVESATSGFHTMAISKKLLKQPNPDSWSLAISRLSAQELSSGDRDSIMGLLNNLADLPQKIGTPEGWVKWWNETGKNGLIDSRGHWKPKP